VYHLSIDKSYAFYIIVHHNNQSERADFYMQLLREYKHLRKCNRRKKRGTPFLCLGLYMTILQDHLTVSKSLYVIYNIDKTNNTCLLEEKVLLLMERQLHQPQREHATSGNMVLLYVPKVRTASNGHL
jgi:hypothetical protein